MCNVLIHTNLTAKKFTVYIYLKCKHEYPLQFFFQIRHDMVLQRLQNGLDHIMKELDSTKKA